MKREMTELENRIYKDIQSEIWKYYDSVHITYKEESFDDTVINFFSYLYRLIPAMKRNVFYSKELLKKIDFKEITEEQIEILKKYENAFSNGENMNLFLSNNIKDVRKPDFLLYTWNLYHLHMSGKFVENVNQMKNNRSDTQLLCIITGHDIYFIDVIPHPQKAEDYFDLRSLEIIQENGWMEKIGFFEMKDIIPGSLQPKVTEIKDIFNLYTQGINIAFEFQGKAYCPLSLMSGARRPVAASQELIKMKKEISKCKDEEGTYKGFQLCSYKGKLLGMVMFEIQQGAMKYSNIF